MNVFLLVSFLSMVFQSVIDATKIVEVEVILVYVRENISSTELKMRKMPKDIETKFN